MTNEMTQREYNQIKNRRVSVISFNQLNQRTMTYSGLTYKKAVEEIIRRQADGQICMIAPIANGGIEHEGITAGNDNLAAHRAWVQKSCQTAFCMEVP